MRFNARPAIIRPGAIRAAIDNPKTDAVLFKEVVEIRGKAIAIFQSRTKHSNAPTYPLYVTSFQIFRRGERWVLSNTDPAAFWVEFGAYITPESRVRHPRHPMILRYAPIRLAVDASREG